MATNNPPTCDHGVPSPCGLCGEFTGAGIAARREGERLTREARAWIADCFDDVNARALTAAEVRAGIEAHYDGGWPAFVRDGGY